MTRPDDQPIGERGTLSSAEIVIAYSASGDSSGSPVDVPRASLRRRRSGFRLLQRPMRIETNVGVAGTTGAERQQRRQSQDGVPTERWRATRISSSPFAGSSYVVRNLSFRTDSALSWRASDSTSAGWSRNSFLTLLAISRPHRRSPWQDTQAPGRPPADPGPSPWSRPSGSRRRAPGGQPPPQALDGEGQLRCGECRGRAARAPADKLQVNGPPWRPAGGKAHDPPPASGARPIGGGIEALRRDRPPAHPGAPAPKPSPISGASLLHGAIQPMSRFTSLP